MNTSSRFVHPFETAGSQFNLLPSSRRRAPGLLDDVQVKEVDPPARIRHTQLYDPGDMGGSMNEAGEVMITLTFEERDGATTVTTRIEYGSKEARDGAMASGMTDGMEFNYQSLDTLFLKSRPE